MLTGRCKQDFETWLEKNNHTHWLVFFEGLPDTVKYSYIIEWFDSVGIYIIVDIWHREFRNNIMYFGFSVESKQTHILTGRYHIKTRQEATKAAIEKANELYNEKYVEQCSQ